MSHMTTYNYRGLPSCRPRKKIKNDPTMTARLIATQPNHRNPKVFPEEKKPEKYHNVPTNVDGIKFRSGKEARRYQELLMAEKAGLISNLKVHPRFKIDVEGGHICDYIADFSYNEVEAGRLIVEDTKGKDKKTGWDTRTEAYKLKKVMMRVINRIEVREV